ncbi:hypothetical protein QUB05_13325 [Microcoleus sp. F10-C6]|uniref:hypothetical protein n=1 Tax=unclassified Microcoleus TaxID=2642155 RepID=UPI002FD59A73
MASGEKLLSRNSIAHSEKKARSSAPVNQTGIRASNRSSFPLLASTRLPPKALAASGKPEGAQLLKTYRGCEFHRLKAQR